MEPKIGPIHGVHPKPNARPITYGNKIFLDSLASNLFSKFRYEILIIPNNWNENIIIIIPAIILKTSEFCKSAWPKKDAEAPNNTNTVENPKQNRTRGKKFVCFDSNISWSDCPEMYETYPGIKGNTQGDKKLINPAPKAIKNSNITQYFS